MTTLESWCQKNLVLIAVLFGSQATGKTHARSDVDLAIWTKRPFVPDDKLRWLVELEAIFANAVSLVLVSPELDPILGFEIVKQGRLLYEQTDELWFKERARLWHAYNDSLPFRRAARRQLQQFVKDFQDGA